MDREAGGCEASRRKTGYAPASTHAVRRARPVGAASPAQYGHYRWIRFAGGCQSGPSCGSQTFQAFIRNGFHPYRSRVCTRPISLQNLAIFRCESRETLLTSSIIRSKIHLDNTKTFSYAMRRGERGHGNEHERAISWIRLGLPGHAKDRLARKGARQHRWRRFYRAAGPGWQP